MLRLLGVRLLWDAHVTLVDKALGENWRDYVLCLGQLVFLIALIPSLVSDAKPPFLTSLITALGVSVFAYVYATVNWKLTTALTIALAIAWWTLAFQVS